MFEIENSHPDCCTWICFPCIFMFMVCEKCCICPLICCAELSSRIGSTENLTPVGPENVIIRENSQFEEMKEEPI